jgi:hypothetical protein
MAEAKKEEKKEVLSLKADKTYNQAPLTTGYRICINGNIIYSFNMGQVLACCGTAYIANANMHTGMKVYTEEVKNFIFDEIIRLAKYMSKRNIIYHDTPNGFINKILKDKFETIASYRNPNSGNIVEIKSLLLDPSELGQDYPASEYDDPDWEEPDDDDDEDDDY